MKALRLALLITSMAISASAFAQTGGMSSAPPAGGPMGPHGHMPSVDDRVKNLTKQLNLSSDQQTQVRGILQKEQDQMQQVMQDTSMSRQDKHSKMMNLHQSTTSDINGVLNDEQKQKYAAYQQQQMQRMQQHRPGMGMGPGGPGAGPGSGGSSGPDSQNQ